MEVTLVNHAFKYHSGEEVLINNVPLSGHQSTIKFIEVEARYYGSFSELPGTNHAGQAHAELLFDSMAVPEIYTKRCSEILFPGTIWRDDDRYGHGYKFCCPVLTREMVDQSKPVKGWEWRISKLWLGWKPFLLSNRVVAVLA